MEFSSRADPYQAHPQALISDFDYIGWPTPPQLGVSAPLSTPYWVGQLFATCKHLAFIAVDQAHVETAANQPADELGLLRHRAITLDDLRSVDAIVLGLS